MVPAGGGSIGENILIVNPNKKFTFLNSIKTLNVDKIKEKGIEKMKREYGKEWGEDDKGVYAVLYVNSY